MKPSRAALLAGVDGKAEERHRGGTAEELRNKTNEQSISGIDRFPLSSWKATRVETTVPLFACVCKEGGSRVNQRSMRRIKKAYSLRAQERRERESFKAFVFLFFSAL